MENINKKATTQVSFWCGTREGGFRVRKAHAATMAVAFPFQAFYLLVSGSKAGQATGLSVRHGSGFNDDLVFWFLVFCGSCFHLYFSGTQP